MTFVDGYGQPPRLSASFPAPPGKRWLIGDLVLVKGVGTFKITRVTLQPDLGDLLNHPGTLDIEARFVEGES